MLWYFVWTFTSSPTSCIMPMLAWATQPIFNNISVQKVQISEYLEQISLNILFKFLGYHTYMTCLLDRDALMCWCVGSITLKKLNCKIL